MRQRLFGPVLPVLLLLLCSCSAPPRAPIQSVMPLIGSTPVFQPGAPVFMRIFKEENLLEVWLQHGDRYALYKKYPICFFSGGLGPKLREGDKQSPEGFYKVYPRNMNPNSRYHLSFNLGYPNEYDRAYGRTGNLLMVHGNCVSAGCYAMTDRQIEEIYQIADAALRNGQPYFQVHIFPFRLTPANLAKHQASPWYAFWSNLKEGHDLFEATHRPPDVSVNARRYAFRNDSQFNRFTVRSASEKKLPPG